MNKFGYPKTLLTEPQEDYLKQILLLGSQNAFSELLEHTQTVSTQQLADRMQVKPASVTGMLKKLSELGLVDYEAYRGVKLTQSGYGVAVEIIRHHRLIEAYLHQALGYGWEEVHAEAEKLEHHISEDFERRIAQWLGHPLHDPHGDPIPSVDLTFPEVALNIFKLTQLEAGQIGLVSRVTTRDQDSLNLLSKLGIFPRAEITLVEQNTAGVRVKIGTERFLLPFNLASTLLVSVSEEQ